MKQESQHPSDWAIFLDCRTVSKIVQRRKLVTILLECPMLFSSCALCLLNDRNFTAFAIAATFMALWSWRAYEDLRTMRRLLSLLDSYSPKNAAAFDEFRRCFAARGAITFYNSLGRWIKQEEAARKPELDKMAEMERQIQRQVKEGNAE